PRSEYSKEAFLQIAQSYYNKGDLEKAVEYYSSYLEEYPEDEDLSYVLDQIQLSFYRMGKSDEDMQEFIKKYPLSKWASDIYWRLGANYFNEEKYSQAQNYFQKVILDFPDSSQIERAYYYNAESYFLAGDYEKAIRAYEQGFISNFPEHEYVPDAMFNLGIAYFNLEEYDKSIEAYENFLDMYPEHELAQNAFINMAVTYNRIHQVSDAVEAYERLIESFPESERVPSIYLKIGELHEENNNYEKAIEYYRKIEEDKKEYPEAQYYIGICYNELGMGDEEKEVYENMVEYHDKSNEYRLAALFELAAITREHDREKAEAYYRDIISNAPSQEWKERANQQLSELN
ncbi:MAG: tetratricopeptide repeat protein, partial [Elusimicrobiota bacterium]